MEQTLQRDEATTPVRDQRGRWIAIGAAIVVVGVALLAGPRPLALPERTTGDHALAAEVRAALGPRPGTRAVAVARVGPDGIRTAGLGDSGDPLRPQVDAESAFEIGSITKGLNGMLLAELSAEGMVTEDTRVGALTDDDALRSSAVGDVTLAELAQHHSGLQSVVAGGPLGFARSLATDFIGWDPYPDWSADALLEAAARQDTDGRGSFAYSNFGAAVLGHTVAAAADTDYPGLLRERVLTPLGMESTTVVTSSDALPAQRIRGIGYTGQVREPWIGAGYAPAGSGVWSTAGDLARLVQAMLDGSAPGVNAAEPRFRIDDGEQVGLGWFTRDVNGRDVISHAGGTGGFSSWVGVDRDAGRGVVVLSSSDRNVAQLGTHLLGVAPPPVAQGWSMPGVQGLLGLGIGLMAVVMAVAMARRTRAGRVTHRLDLVGGVATSVIMLAVAWRRGPWLETPWLLWSAAAAVAGVAIVLQCWYARHLPWRASGWRPLVGVVINAAIALVFVVAIL